MGVAVPSSEGAETVGRGFAGASRSFVLFTEGRGKALGEGGAGARLATCARLALQGCLASPWE